MLSLRQCVLHELRASMGELYMYFIIIIIIISSSSSSSSSSGGGGGSGGGGSGGGGISLYEAHSYRLLSKFFRCRHPIFKPVRAAADWTIKGSQQ